MILYLESGQPNTWLHPELTSGLHHQLGTLKMLFIVTQKEAKLYSITLVYQGYSKFLFQHSLCCR